MVSAIDTSIHDSDRRAFTNRRRFEEVRDRELAEARGREEPGRTGTREPAAQPPAAAPAPASPTGPQPTMESAADARRVAANASSIAQMKRRAERRVPGPTARPDAQPSGPENPLSTHARAARELGREPSPQASHPFVRYKNEIRGQLDRLGINRTSTDRVHIDDGDPDHGGTVARTAAGRTSLARGSDVTLNIDGLPRNDKSPNLSTDQQRRFDTFDQRIEETFKRNPGVDQLARIGAESMERSLVEKQLRLENIRNHTPDDGKKTFVNMSWGQTPHEAAQNMMGAMMSAPPGSTLHKQLSDFNGGHMPRSQHEVDRAMKGLVYPALERAMNTPEHQARMQSARAGLEQELDRGREKGILAFQAAGNAFDDASRLGKPEFSQSSTSGVRGLLNVGAVDLNGPGPHDDRVSMFSSDGNIQLSAPGSKIPTGVRNGRAVEEDGTSFASPNALDVARTMSAANPNLSANDIARLITDPRAVNDIPGTTRDGAGHVDPFAAVLLARNSGLSRGQIEWARQELAKPNADLATIRARLGLGN